MRAKFQGQKIHTEKDIQNLPTFVALRIHFNIPTLTPSQGLNFLLFTMKFLA